jgi:Flp pilus assembly pilin Flp
MKFRYKFFVKDDDGAITVDWVVLCAAAVGLTVLISTMMTDGAVGLGDKVTAFMSNWSFD